MGGGNFPGQGWTPGSSRNFTVKKIFGVKPVIFWAVPVDSSTLSRLNQKISGLPGFRSGTPIFSGFLVPG